MSNESFEERVEQTLADIQKFKEVYWSDATNVELCAMMAQLEFQVTELKAEQALQAAAQ